MQPSLPFDAARSYPGPDAPPPVGTHAPQRVSTEEPQHLSAPSPQHPSTIDYVRHPRAKRYVIRVAANGSVRVTIPRWGSKRDGAAFVEQQRAWIEKQQARVARHREHLSHGSADPQADLQLLAQARRELPPRLLLLAAAHGLKVHGVSIRNQRSRWGSCSRKGHISLNWRLVQMPAAVRDYVMLHELMHLKRMDHSPAFWSLVAAACPEYEAARRYLRTIPLGKSEG